METRYLKSKNDAQKNGFENISIIIKVSFIKGLQLFKKNY